MSAKRSAGNALSFACGARCCPCHGCCVHNYFPSSRPCLWLSGTRGNCPPRIVPLLTEVGFPPNPCTPSWRSRWWAEQQFSDRSVLPLRSSWRDSLLQLLCDLPTSSSFTVLVYVFLFLRSVKAVVLKLCFLLGRFLWSRMACHIFFFLCVK